MTVKAQERPLWPGVIFVSGTDTGIGKTVVAAALALGLGAVYWKPVQSGLEDGGDRDWVRRHAGLPAEQLADEAYRFGLPLSPHLAASAEGVEIDMERLVAPHTGGRPLVIEGAGGVMVPLNRDCTMVDLMKQLAVPVLLVGRNTLGTINHTLLSIEHLRRSGLDIFGVVLNGGRNADHRRAIEHYGGVKVIGEVDRRCAIGPAELARIFADDLGGGG
jgi:dethiobiotin synthetase